MVQLFFDKLWDKMVIALRKESLQLRYIDLHFSIEEKHIE